MIESADYVIDIGPKAGKYGGKQLKGTSNELLKTRLLQNILKKRIIQQIEVPT
jgi:excinuclease ABC subunit A